MFSGRITCTDTCFSNRPNVYAGSKSGDYEELKEKLHTKVLGNHSLLLQNVKEDKQGYYLCQASNGIGNAIGKVIQVNVKCK